MEVHHPPYGVVQILKFALDHLADPRDVEGAVDLSPDDHDKIRDARAWLERIHQACTDGG